MTGSYAAGGQAEQIQLMMANKHENTVDGYGCIRVVLRG